MNFDFLKIFTYNPQAPLIFTRFYFWAFFTVVLFGYTWLANKRFSRSLYLLIFSLFFYYKSSGFFFFLLIFSTIVGFFIGKWIDKSQNEKGRKWLVALGVFINLGILAYFKYAYFIVDAVNQMFGTDYVTHNYLAEFANLLTGSRFDTAKIFLPVGISFYTFQTISYIVDVYRKELKAVKSIVDFGFYVSFFPQLVAGPIVRAAEFIPQIYKKYSLTRYEFGLALFYVLRGLVKKIMIGDYIAVNFVDRIFSNPEMYTGLESMLALIGYSLQVYTDFSGYTDIAIGVALWMGFRLPQNFNSPYKALNTGDFWKRWHISLSSWLKDYLYIPLGGNRTAGAGTYINFLLILAVFILLASNTAVTIGLILFAIIIFVLLRFSEKARWHIQRNLNTMITMLLGGLWHGSSWNFMIWGGLNGLGVLVYKYWRKISPWEKYDTKLARVWKITLTFTFITFTRVFFRAPDYPTAATMLSQIAHSFNFAIFPQVMVAYYKVWIIMLFGFITHWLSYDFKDKWRDKFINASHWVQVIISVLVIFVVYQSICSDMQAFIYFQF